MTLAQLVIAVAVLLPLGFASLRLPKRIAAWCLVVEIAADPEGVAITARTEDGKTRVYSAPDRCP